MNSEIMDDIVAIVDEVTDVEETCRPFGKRWAAQQVKLSSAHIAALQDGKLLAVDVNNEYVVFLKIDQTDKESI
jgi:hypothetical protein